MGLNNGQTIDQTDFISKAQKNVSPAADINRVPKLDIAAKIDRVFLPSFFGGDGSDGALTVSAGTTNIDLGGARHFVKNYSSISITGTGAITFSNPHANGTFITLKSAGDVTITSSAARAIDGRGAGAATGTPAQAIYGAINQGAGPTNNAAGGVSPLQALDKNYVTAWMDTNYILPLAPGAGGGGASAGRGGAALLIECAGALNFTGTIDCSGAAGTASAHGGGGAGTIAAIYNVLTANSGTLTVLGGAGHALGAQAQQGGGGASLFNNGIAAVQAVGGGAGGAGLGWVLPNKYF